MAFAAGPNQTRAVCKCLQPGEQSGNRSGKRRRKEATPGAKAHLVFL
jgi:hypothetical protein